MARARPYDPYNLRGALLDQLNQRGIDAYDRRHPYPGSMPLVPVLSNANAFFPWNLLQGALQRDPNLAQQTNWGNAIGGSPYPDNPFAVPPRSLLFNPYGIQNWDPRETYGMGGGMNRGRV